MFVWFYFSVDKSGLSLLSLLKIDQSCILEIFRRLENIVLSEETEEARKTNKACFFHVQTLDFKTYA